MQAGLAAGVASRPGARFMSHDESLAGHGGNPGLRDDGLLESALALPQHLEAYGHRDLADLAVAQGVGLARNHPVADGNERAMVPGQGGRRFSDAVRGRQFANGP
jgi:hypothetical protein